MRTSLTAGLNAEDKKLFMQDFKSSAFMRKHIQNVMRKKIETYYAEMRNKDGYEKENWALNQADSIGYVRAMNELISLLES